MAIRRLLAGGLVVATLGVVVPTTGASAAPGDPLPDIVAETAFVDESAGTVSIAVVRLEDPSDVRTVEVTIAPATGLGFAPASIDADVAAFAGPQTVVFAAGSDLAQLSVEVLDDTAWEGPEDFDLVFVDPLNQADSGRAVVTIVDDDVPTLGFFSQQDVLFEESSSGRVRVESFSMMPEHEIVFRVATQDGSAVADIDYVPFDTEVILPATGSPFSAMTDIELIGDDEPDPAQRKTFEVVWYGPGFSTGGTDVELFRTELTIVDNDIYWGWIPPAGNTSDPLVIDVYSPLDGSPVDLELPFELLVDEWPFVEDEVTLSLRGGTNGTGVNVVRGSMVVTPETIAGGGPEPFLLSYEPGASGTTSFVIEMSNRSSAQRYQNLRIDLLTGLPDFDLASTFVSESSGTLLFTRSGEGPPSVPVWLEPSVGLTGATLGVDVLDVGTLSLDFDPGSSSASVELAVLDDELFEGPESIDVVVGDRDVPARQQRFTVTIVDEDLPTFSIEVADSVKESEGLISATVVASEAPVNNVVVTLRPRADQAEADTDFIGADSSVGIAAGETRSSTGTIALVDDDITETFTTETMHIDAVGAGWGTGVDLPLATAPVTIVEDDPFYTFGVNVQDPAGPNGKRFVPLESILIPETVGNGEVFDAASNLVLQHEGPFPFRSGEAILGIEPGDTQGSADVNDYSVTANVTTLPNDLPPAIALTAFPDQEPEDLESVVLRVNRDFEVDGSVQVEVLDGSLRVDIVDNLSMSFVDRAPIDEEGGPVDFALRLSAPLPVDLPIQLSTGDTFSGFGAFPGAADFLDNDFVHFDRIVVIPAGETEVLIPVTPIDNDIPGLRRREGRLEAWIPGNGPPLAFQIFIIEEDEIEPRLTWTTDPPYETKQLTVIEDDAEPTVFEFDLFNPSVIELTKVNAKLTDQLSQDQTGLNDVIAVEFLNPSTGQALQSAGAEGVKLVPGEIARVRITVKADSGVDAARIQIELTSNEYQNSGQGQIIDLQLFIDIDDRFDAPLVDPGENVGDDVREAVQDLAGESRGAADQFARFDEPGSAHSPPLVPGQLPDLFNLDDLFAGFSLSDFDDAADTLEELIADFEVQGCRTDFATEGIGGAPVAPEPDEIVQFRCSLSIGTAGMSELFDGDNVNTATPGILDGLADTFALDATVGWSADATLEVVVGVDGEGVYLLGGSGIALDIGGIGDVAGTGTLGGLGGLGDTVIVGEARADIVAELRLDPDRTRRVRLDELGPIFAAGLSPAAAGDAHMELAGVMDGASFDWIADWALTEGTSTTTASLAATVEIPGVENPAGEPVSIQLDGQLNGDRWALSGQVDEVGDLVVDGFAIDELSASAVISPTIFTVDATLGLQVGDAADPFVVDVALAVDVDGWTATGQASTEELDIGGFHLEQLVIDVTAAHAAAGNSTTVDVLVTSDLVEFGDPDSNGFRATDIAGVLTGSGTASLTASSWNASVGGVLSIEASDVTFSTPDPDGVVLRLATAVATSSQLGNTTISVTDLVVGVDGRFGAASVTVEQPAGFAESIGLAGLVPVDITALTLDYPDRDAAGRIVDLASFVVTIDGIVRPNAFTGLPFDPVIQLGGDVITTDTPIEQRQVSLRAFVESVDPLVIHPLDLGPITLGIRGLQVGEVSLDAEISAEGFVSGTLLPGVGGTAGVNAVFDDNTIDVTGTFTGGFVDDASGVGIDGSASIEIDATTSGGVEVSDLRFDIDVSTRFADGAVSVTADLTQVSFTELSLGFGDVMDLAVTDAVLDLTPDPGAPILAIGGNASSPGTGASIAFRDESTFAGWGGRVGNIGLGADLVPVVLDGFFASVTTPDGELFGLPSFLPFEITEVGVAFGPGALAPGTKLDTSLLLQLRLRVSGGLVGTDAFPVSAKVQGLEVDLGRLVSFDPTAPLDLATFPITNLDGVEFAIEPELSFGEEFAVSGSLRFGVVDVGGEPVLFGRIAGAATSPIMSGGVDVVISQYGPVLLKVEAPLGVPLGPSGFVLTSVTGAASFGDVTIDVPPPGQPEALLTNLVKLPTEITIDADAIRDAIAPVVAAGVPTWDAGFAIALRGDLTHLGAPGMFEGRATVAATFGTGLGSLDPGFQLVGHGAVSAFGIPLSLPGDGEGEIEVEGDFAVAAFLIDLSDPSQPAFDVAFEMPSPGSPLAVMFPARVTASAALRTDGVVDGVIAGFRVFFEEAEASVLAHLQANIDADSSGALAQLLIDDPAVPLRDQILDTLASPRGPELVAALLVALADAVDPAEFFADIADAATAALRAAGNEFDPSFVLRGRIQPQMFGLPLGSPTSEVEMIIDKDSVSFEITASMIEALKAQLDLVSGGLGGGLVTLTTLGASDRLTFGVQAPFPDLLDIVLGAPGADALPPLDSVAPSQNWAVTVGGELSIAGMSATVSGFMTTPGNQTFVDAQIERRFEPTDTDVPLVPDRIAMIREQDYNNLLEYGGLVLNGRLTVPRLITDPVDVAGDLYGTFPEDPAQAFEWFGALGDGLTAAETPASLTLFIPGLPDVAGLGQAAAKTELEQWSESISVTGVVDGTARTPGGPRTARLLSVPIGQGRLVATTAGLEITAQIPMLGLTGRFVARVDERTGPGGEPIPIPVAGLELDASLADAQTALAELGVPPLLSSGDEATLSIRAYTAGFAPGDSDPTKRGGGLVARGTVDIDGIVEGGSAELIVDLAAGSGGVSTTPDFTMTVAAAEIGPFFGVAVTNATITVTKLDEDVAIDLVGSGSFELSPTQQVAFATVTGNISTDGSARLDAQFDSAGLPLGQFRIEGGATITIDDSGFDVTVEGHMDIPGVVTGASVSGAVGSGGIDRLSVNLDEFDLPFMEFSGLSAELVRSGPSSYTLDVAGAVNITGLGSAPGQPNLQFSGRIDSGGDFSLDIEGTMRVAGIAVTGDLEIESLNGIVRLQGALSGSFELFGHALARATFEVEFANGVLVLRLPQSNPALIDLGFVSLRLAGEIRSDGRFDMTGSVATSGAFLGVSWDGSIEVRVASSGGISGEFDGLVSVGGLTATTEGSMSSAGAVRGLVGVDLDSDGDFNGVWIDLLVTRVFVPERVEFEFEIGGSDTTPDTKAPVFAPVPDLVIEYSRFEDSFIRVNFPLPVANDDRSGQLIGRCDLNPGATVLAKDVTVTCAASDAAGNTATTSFDIDFRRVIPKIADPFEEIKDLDPQIPVVIVGGDDGMVGVRRSGLKPGAPFGAVVFSEPQSIGEGTIDADGVLRFDGVLPTDLPAGEHRLEMWSFDDAGTRRQTSLAILIDEAGQLAQVATGEAPTCNGMPATIDMSLGAPGVGTEGNDVIVGTSGQDNIVGLGGDDVICGAGGDDVIEGGDGNDILEGGTGDDVVRGGPGTDVANGNEGNDRVLGGIGDDTLNGGQGNDFIGGFGGHDTIFGGPGNDTIFGGFGADNIQGNGGNDSIFGLIGDDIISGGPGRDLLNGDRGNDTIHGNGGDDTINGGNADDALWGDSGNDVINGGKADDALHGGAGTDTCTGNKHNTADTADPSCETTFGVP